MADIAVFGMGYLGATHAACMAELGHNVLGVDVDEAKVAKLASGDLPFYEPELADVLTTNLASGRLRFTTSYEEAAVHADVHFLGVGTPQKEGEFAADLRFVEAVIDTLAPLLTRSAVILGKSTVPVGTAHRLAARARELSPAGDEVELAWNPEFLREGHAVHDTLSPDRVVLGIDRTQRSRAESVARELYADLIARDIPLLVTISRPRSSSSPRQMRSWQRRYPSSMLLPRYARLSAPTSPSWRTRSVTIHGSVEDS